MPFRAQLIVAAVLAALAFGGGWMVNGWRMDAKLASLQADHASVLEQQANAVVASVQAARQIEQKRTEIVESQRDIAIEQNEVLATDVAAGAAVSERLRGQLSALRARHASRIATPANGGQGEQDTDAIGLLIDMLQGMDGAGRELAEYADRLKIAGLACERTYDGVRDAQ